jgi:pimeloyl-ACP methyl ester carboxylesterase
MPYHEKLTANYSVHAPSHPGYNGSERPDWVDSIPDIARFHLAYLRQEMPEEKAIIMGFSMGGWIAAEMAAMCPQAVKGLILVDAVGIKAPVGEIAELLMVSPSSTQHLSYYDVSKAPDLNAIPPEEQQVLWSNREMTSRLCWKPYMHNPNLPDYLKLISVPSTIIWGRQDGIVPLSCGERYRDVLAGSELHVIEECGHSPQNEKPEEFLQIVSNFCRNLA